MMSYKQFIQELEDDILPSEAERRSECKCSKVCQFDLIELAVFSSKVYLYFAPCISFSLCYFHLFY